jgi:hypothetical protein
VRNAQEGIIRPRTTEISINSDFEKGETNGPANAPAIFVAALRRLVGRRATAPALCLHARCGKLPKEHGIYMLPCTLLGAMVPLAMIENAALRPCSREGGVRFQLAGCEGFELRMSPGLVDMIIGLSGATRGIAPIAGIRCVFRM